MWARGDVDRGPTSAGIGPAEGETGEHRLAGSRPARRQRRNGAAAMTTQIGLFGSDQDWAMPALLVVLMTILAMLGIVANVAAG
jgi:hypothetical protein